MGSLPQSQETGGDIPIQAVKLRESWVFAPQTPNGRTVDRERDLGIFLEQFWKIFSSLEPM
ncbi:unnamed protein product, partial [Linum tenue]